MDVSLVVGVLQESRQKARYVAGGPECMPMGQSKRGGDAPPGWKDSAAAVKDRIAGLLRAAWPLGVWLDINVGRQPSGESRVSRALWPQMRTA
jgi:hypothetical protein